MSDGIEDYYNLIHQPWGKMFYDILWTQLMISDVPKMKLLDFGSGFGVTASYYAKHHEVIAIEPNTAMSARRFTENKYTQISGGYEKLAEYPDQTFDTVICHNVLEYTVNKREVFTELSRVLNYGGILSVIKHNQYGRAMAAAVFDDDPEKALSLIADKKNDAAHRAFGNRELYDDRELISWAEHSGLMLSKCLGIRSLFALSKNNDIKFTSEWYNKMLTLECTVSDMDEYKGIAFFHHLIFKKGEK